MANDDPFEFATRRATPEEVYDRERDLRKHDAPIDRIVNETAKRIAVAKLLGYCEGLCSSGNLTETAEAQLRLLIAESLSAHGMTRISEREHSDV